MEKQTDQLCLCHTHIPNLLILELQLSFSIHLFQRMSTLVCNWVTTMTATWYCDSCKGRFINHIHRLGDTSLMLRFTYLLSSYLLPVFSFHQLTLHSKIPSRFVSKIQMCENHKHDSILFHCIEVGQRHMRDLS